MKTKHIIKRAAAMLTGAIAIAAAGCQRAPQTETPGTVNYRFEVSATYHADTDEGGGTRAVKSGWTENDMILVHFDGGETNRLMLKYDAQGVWQPMPATSVVSITTIDPDDDGTGTAQAIHAIHIDAIVDGGGLNPAGTIVADSDMVFDDDGTYTVVGQTVYVSLNMNRRVTTRVSVEGLTDDGTNYWNWVLAGPDLSVARPATLAPGAFDSAGGSWEATLPTMFKPSGIAAGVYDHGRVMPYHAAGEKSFFVRDNGATEGTTFELSNLTTGQTWTRTYEGNLVAGEAVVITGPDGTGNDGWTELTAPAANTITFTTTYAGDVDNLYLWGTGEATIDWGDGSTPDQVVLQALPARLSEYPAGTKITHTWAAGDVPPSRTVTITGTVTGLATPGTVSGDRAEAADAKGITSLDVRGMASLEYLKCRSELITALDVSGNPALKFLACDLNYSLTALNVSGCPDLIWLSTEDTGIASLDISANTALVDLCIGHNPDLAGISVGHLVDLETLYLNNVASLTSLDIRGLTKVKDMAFGYNPGIEVLADWGGLTELVHLWFDGNDLDKAALTAILTALPDRTGKETSGVLDCTENPGFDDFRAEQSDAATAKNWTIAAPFVPPIIEPVTDITGVPTAGAVGEELVLQYTGIDSHSGATVVPDEATNKTIVWSLIDAGTTGVVENMIGTSTTYYYDPEKGELFPIVTTSVDRPTAEGTLKLRATIVNGRAAGMHYTQDFTITIGPAEVLTAENFPDANFLAWCKAQTAWDTDGNGSLSYSEAMAVKKIDFYSTGTTNVQSLEGIEIFENLTFLDCYRNKLTELDVTGLTELTVLGCTRNNITDLKVAGLDKLVEFQCDYNQLTELDVSGMTSLKWLICYNNKIKELDVRGLTSLAHLNCQNNEITDLKVAGLANLIELECYLNKIEALDLTGLPALTEMDCANNLISELNISGLTGLKTLICSGNQMTSLNLGGLAGLRSVSCYDNLLTGLNVAGLTGLDVLECDRNRLTELNLTGLDKLRWLGCNDNRIVSLNLTGLMNFETLRCFNNQLPVLNLSGLVKLKTVRCENNLIEELNLTGLTSLTEINCADNRISDFNLGGLAGLKVVECYNNRLRALNPTGLIGLDRLYCQGNLLTELNLAGLTKFRVLHCYDNQIETLNLTGLMNFESLDCYNNRLSGLSLAGLPKLRSVACEYNPLSELDVSDNGDLIMVKCGNEGATPLTVSVDHDRTLGTVYGSGDLLIIAIHMSGAYKAQEYITTKNTEVRGVTVTDKI